MQTRTLPGACTRMQNSVQHNCTANEILYAQRLQHVHKPAIRAGPSDRQQQTAESQSVTQSFLLVHSHQDQSPVDGPVFFIRHVGQARVSQPCDAGVSMVIDYAVEGSVDAVTDVVVHDLVAAGVLSHAGPVDVQ